jgi:uncharacterized membrane protein YccC
MSNVRDLVRRLPAHVINGVGVSLGVSLIYLAGHLLGGAPAALAASSGAVYASLADLPNPPNRTWLRVLTAAAIGCIVSLLVAALRNYPIALGVALAIVGFLSALTLAWGARAGPISFVGLMTFVFTMAAPPVHTLLALLVLVGWVALGGALYLAWAMLVSACLQPRYRTLALAEVLATTAQLLRSRATLLTDEAQRSSSTPPLEAWIALESALDERLQAARDILFAARNTKSVQRQTALLLLAIDLRDTLLLGQLDLELLGHDISGARVRRALVANYEAIAQTLDQIHHAVRSGLALAPPPDHGASLRLLTEVGVFDVGDPRHRLLPVLADRTRRLFGDLAQMQSLLAGGSPRVALAHEELQMFVSVEGWPLAALGPHIHLYSPVLRHSFRASAALTAAYFIGLVLPWSSHPHWLVLSVAVVLRGSLEQTLTRRNLRLAGTVAGCLIVLGLSHLATVWLSTAVYLGATGLAHAFVVARYFVTATAATVMALLQDHLANPLGGFAVAERLADTAIGALLAWAFSYVLPSWERHGLPRLVARLIRALDAMSSYAMEIPEPGAANLGVRLARREVYEALRAVAAAAQRSRVEPKAVRVPPQSFASLLARSHALMAHLAAIRLLLSRRAGELDREQTQTALAAAKAKLRQVLPSPVAATDELLTIDTAIAGFPEEAPAQALMPWLKRRLQMATVAAAQTAQAAAELNAMANSAANSKAATVRERLP